jgi:hypothetical protein
MIQTQPFNIDVLSTHKVFFLLEHLPKNTTEVDIWIQTPIGYESVDFVDVFVMQDGSLLAAWKHPLQKLPLQNLVAFGDGVTQVLNLYPVERIIDLYDRPVDATSGTFIFSGSGVIDGADWRCDNGYYGPKSLYVEELDSSLINSLAEIVAYEPFMSVAGLGHIMYVESNTQNKPELADLAVNKLNNSIAPVVGRTFQEVLRLIYEWAVLADEPFNSTENVAVTAKNYMGTLRFTEDEIDLIKELTPMQISKFISGSTEARIRPDNITPLSAGISDILFKRMASSSLSFIISRNPGIWDYEEVRQKELDELEVGILRFREYYGVPEYVELTETSRVLEFAEIQAPKQLAYVHNQLRHFANKKSILNGL